MTYQTDALSHGIGNSAVSSQWYNRPDDQKFLSLDSMLNFKKFDASRMTSRTVDTHKVKIIGDYDEANPSRTIITKSITTCPLIGVLASCHNLPVPLPDTLETCPHR